MAVIRVRKLFPARGGRRNFQTRVTYTLVWEVVTDDVNDDEETVYGAVDPENALEKVPVFGDVHPGNPLAVVTDVTPETSDDSPNIWYVNVTYDTQPDTPGSGQPTGTGDLNGPVGERGNTPGAYSQNPLLRTPVWQLSTIDRTEPIEQWLRVEADGTYKFVTPAAWTINTAYKVGKYVSNGGNVYVCDVAGTSAGAGGPAGVGRNIVDNTVRWRFWATLAQAITDPRFAILSPFFHSGGLPFDPPGMTDVSIPTIVVTKNLAVMDILYAMLLKNSVNLLQWGVIPPRCAKVLKLTSGFKEENGFQYVEAQWEIGLDPDTWDTRILDAGYGNYGLRTVQNPAAPPATIQKNVFTRFKDPSGEFFGSPVPMDGNGGMLDPLEDPVYLRGIPRQTKIVDFNELLPFNIPR